MKIITIAASALFFILPLSVSAQESSAKGKIDTLREYIASHPTPQPTSLSFRSSGSSIQPEQSEEKVPPSPLTAEAGFTMLRALGICIGVLLIFLWALQKLGGKRARGRERSITIIDRVPISAKSAVVLLEVSGRKMCLAVGPEQISQLSITSDCEGKSSFDSTLSDICINGEASQK